MKIGSLQISKRVLWIILGAAAIIAVIFIVRGINQAAAVASGNYQTVAVERGNLTAIVGATGTVRANQTAILTWQTSGRIEEVHTAIGDRVQADDVLASLASGSLNQSIILAKADLVTALRALETATDSNLARAQAELALINAEDALTRAEDTRARASYQRGSEDRIDSAEADVVLKQQAVDYAQAIFDTVSGLDPSNVDYAYALSNLAAAKNQLEIAQTNLAYLQGHPDAQDISLIDAQLAVAQAQYDDAQREWERLKDGPDPDDVAAAQARVDALQATISMASLTAPFDGTVTQGNPLPGDLVAPGTSGFRIDDLSHLLIDVEVPEVDINRIQVGQQAVITFDAISSVEYQGEVVRVARVGDVSQTGVNFTITLEITEPDEAVLPGMTAAVNIIVSQIEDVTLVPNRAVRLRNGQRVVYVLRAGQPEAVEIVIGSSSDTQSEILSGNINPGELVILNPPSEFQNSSPFGQ